MPLRISNSGSSGGIPIVTNSDGTKVKLIEKHIYTNNSNTDKDWNCLGDQIYISDYTEVYNLENNSKLETLLQEITGEVL